MNRLARLFLSVLLKVFLSTSLSPLLSVLLRVWSRVLLSVLLALPALAEDAPIVRVTVRPEQVNVGEAASLRVTVLVPTWFRGAPQYPAFELPHLITRLPPDSSYPVSERIGRESWSGIVREYRLFPLLGADYQFSGEVIRVTWADPDSTQPVSADIAVPAVQLRAVVPAGAEALDPYLAGSAFKLERRLDGDTATLAEGDALVLRYSAQLHGLSALFLPPLAPELQLDGVSVYADQAVIEEGDPARRSEKLTLVFTAGGEMTLPGTTLKWWNTQTGQVESAVLEPLTFSVAGKPVSFAERLSEVRVDWRALVIGVLLVGLLGYLLRRWLPSVKRIAQARVTRWRQSEACAFRALRQPVRERDARAVYHGLLAWLDRLEPPGMEARCFARDYGDAALSRAVSGLSDSLYGGTAADNVDCDTFYQGLAAARRRLLKQQRSSRQAALPPLNP